MRAVLATSVVWKLARFAFWIGYHRSAAMRGLGAPGVALSMIVLLYVAGRIGYEVGGFVGAAVPVMMFERAGFAVWLAALRQSCVHARRGTQKAIDLYLIGSL
jgi:hypothetical protein